jgi:hypothetical protein
MRTSFSRSLLLVAALGLVAGCDEVVPPKPAKPVAVVAKPVKRTVAPEPVVKKKPVIVFDDGGDGGGGWN